MTHRVHLFLFQHLKYSQMEYYIHWHLHGRCTKQSIQVFHNYMITYLWLCECLILKFIWKNITSKKRFECFTGIISIKKWTAKNFRRDHLNISQHFLKISNFIYSSNIPLSETILFFLFPLNSHARCTFFPFFLNTLYRIGREHSILTS